MCVNDTFVPDSASRRSLRPDSPVAPLPLPVPAVPPVRSKPGEDVEGPDGVPVGGLDGLDGLDVLGLELGEEDAEGDVDVEDEYEFGGLQSSVSAGFGEEVDDVRVAKPGMGLGRMEHLLDSGEWWCVAYEFEIWNL